MLRRANSKSSNRLSRQKSTSSNFQKSMHIDPVIARQHAQAAAIYAFSRAKERNNIEMGCSKDMPGEFNKIEHHRSSIQAALVDQEAHAVKKQQSVRFVGTNAVENQQSIERGERPDTFDQKMRISSLQPTALTNDISVPAIYSPSSRSSSLGKGSMSKVTSETYTTTLIAYDEYYTKEDDVASTPSSYRRIRKSKSSKTLFSPLNASSILFSKGTSDSDYNERIIKDVPWGSDPENQPALRAPKSMSFLKGGREYISTSRRQDRDTAVQMARDKFLHQIEQQRLREQPSFLFRPRAKREPKPFRQSVRSGSTGSTSKSVGSTVAVEQRKEISIKVKARKASKSFKKALKNIFRRGRDDGNDKNNISVQQMDAYQPHDDKQTIKTADDSHMEFSDLDHPENATVTIVKPAVPSLHTVPSAQQLCSAAGSIRSLRSEGSSKSRVTSWTSTAENTMNSRYAPTDKEQQRLSIIQENGTHISSSSFRRPTVSSQLSACPAFHRPRNTKDLVCPGQASVDSHRVYSALMKRLDDNSPKAKLYAQRKSSIESPGIMERVPSRNSSAESLRTNHHSRTLATIRHVREDFGKTNHDKKQQEENFASPLHDNGDVFFSTPHIESPSSTNQQEQPKNVGTEASAIYHGQEYDVASTANTSHGRVLSPQQVAAQNELFMKLAKPPGAIRETRSTFFCQPSLNARRSTSPYRQASSEADYIPTLNSSAGSAQQSEIKAILSTPSASYLNSKNAEFEQHLHARDAYTESIYSQSAGIRTPPAQEVQRFTLGEYDLPLGHRITMASVDRPAYRLGLPNRRDASRASSQEWKGWLSAEVSALENAGEIERLIKVDYALPSMPNSFGHVREHAQIVEEDIEIRPQTVNTVKQPTDLLNDIPQQPGELKPILKLESSISSITIPIPPPPPPPPPSALPCSPLHSVQSPSSLRSADTTVTQGTTTSAPASAVKLASLSSQQLLRPSLSATPLGSNMSVKLVRRRRRPSNPLKPSPGIGAAVEKQFGSTKSRASFSGTENRFPLEDLNSAEEVDLMDPTASHELDAQALGSMRMVDLFLSSRRRRVAGSDEGNAFL